MIASHSKRINRLIVLVASMLLAMATTEAFSPESTKTSALKQRQVSRSSPSAIFFFGNNDKGSSQPEESSKDAEGAFGGGFFRDLKGMMNNFDDVVDDFVYKRMGAGEQWYGKRKYNPSGKFDGDYNGMGQSDQLRIEIARVQKEEMEKRRQRRLAEEEERRKNQMS